MTGPLSSVNSGSISHPTCKTILAQFPHCCKYGRQQSYVISPGVSKLYVKKATPVAIGPLHGCKGLNAETDRPMTE